MIIFGLILGGIATIGIAAGIIVPIIIGIKMLKKYYKNQDDDQEKASKYFRIAFWLFALSAAELLLFSGVISEMISNGEFIMG